MTSFNLRRVKLRPGEELREALEVDLPVLELGGQRYVAVPDQVVAELAITRTTTGTALALAFDARLTGPCYRCLGDAVVDLPIRAREYQAGETGGHADEQMTSPYVVDDRVDVSAWARDAVALALPDQILCRRDCAGLCAVCGRSLNEEPHGHDEREADPRWAALEELRSRP